MAVLVIFQDENTYQVGCVAVKSHDGKWTPPLCISSLIFSSVSIIKVLFYCIVEVPKSDQARVVVDYKSMLTFVEEKLVEYNMHMHENGKNGKFFTVAENFFKFDTTVFQKRLQMYKFWHYFTIYFQEIQIVSATKSTS